MRSLGITNLVRRTTAAESELRREEFVEGAERLRALVADVPAGVAGHGRHRRLSVGFGDAKASVGRQEARLGDTGLWVLPNPSGLNANYQLPALTAAFPSCARSRSREGPSRGDVLRDAGRTAAWLERTTRPRRSCGSARIARRPGRPSLTWPQIVDELLCFGWIDGLRRGHRRRPLGDPRSRRAARAATGVR